MEEISVNEVYQKILKMDTKKTTLTHFFYVLSYILFFTLLANGNANEISAFTVKEVFHQKRLTNLLNKYTDAFKW